VEESRYPLKIIHDKIQSIKKPHTTVQVNLRPRACTGILLRSFFLVGLFWGVFLVLELCTRFLYEFLIEGRLTQIHSPAPAHTHTHTHTLLHASLSYHRGKQKKRMNPYICLKNMGLVHKSQHLTLMSFMRCISN